MQIRKANEGDIERIIELLSQVLELHASIRPDIFVPNTTKYTRDELITKLQNSDTDPIYVAVDDSGNVAGYAFCQIKSQPNVQNMVGFDSMYIDDLCVDEKYRGEHIGSALFKYVRGEAKRMGCYEIGLNVWEGNDRAMEFYRNMGLKTRNTYMEYIL